MRIYLSQHGPSTRYIRGTVRGDSNLAEHRVTRHLQSYLLSACLRARIAVKKDLTRKRGLTRKEKEEHATFVDEGRVRIRSTDFQDILTLHLFVRTVKCKKFHMPEISHIMAVTYRVGDGTVTSDHSCTNCTVSKTRCTYTEPSKVRLG